MRYSIRNILIGFSVVLFSHSSMGQIKLSEQVQDSEITNKESYPLILVDFWATWCAPCIHAKTYLQVLQNEFKEDIYILSLTEESPNTVQRFLKKKPTKLAVGIDYKGETFKKYEVRVLPEAKLFNAKGDIVWQGHPADLKSQTIKRLLNKYKQKIDLSRFFKVKPIVQEVKKDITFNGPIKIETEKTDKPLDLNILETDDYLRMDGSLKAIVSHLMNVYKGQIEMDDNLHYTIFFKKPYTNKNALLDLLIQELNIDFKKGYVSKDVLYLDLEQAHLWDQTQINWGKNTSHFLISDFQIEADNVTVDEIAYEMAKQLELPVVVHNASDYSSTKHDWQIPYKYFQLMIETLEDTYGIKVSKSKGKVEQYVLTKKAP